MSNGDFWKLCDWYAVWQQKISNKRVLIKYPNKIITCQQVIENALSVLNM